MLDTLLVYITTPDIEEAEAMATDLIAHKLAACANILPSIYSIFYWEGKLNKKTESLLLLKTTQEKFPHLMIRAKQLHSYKIPCIVAVPLESGLPDFLEWIKKEIF